MENPCRCPMLIYFTNIADTEERTEFVILVEYMVAVDMVDSHIDEGPFL
jgi:hypothetical protein